MRTLSLSALALLAAAPLAAQNSHLLYCGRFPFVSLDAPNERANGSINQISEFAITGVTPGAGAVARSWVPATTDQCFIGDPGSSGSYTYYDGFKTYFQRINKAGLFVRFVDKVVDFDARDVFWTVRDQESGIDIQAFDQNGSTTVTIRPGDFVRHDVNGNLEYFITQAQFDTAMGTQTGSFASGASALCQDAQGNLFYSPAEGGHWVNGNLNAPLFAYDGSIVMIPAAAITYDAAGNVASVQADSAMLLFDEVSGSPSIRDMVHTNAGAYRNDGTPIDGSSFGQSTTNMIGLDLDPSGGTLQSAFLDTAGNPVSVPNLVFSWDQGTWGGTIFTTGPNIVGQPGAVATINGVKCGSDTNGVPADGSWLGVQLDVANFQPTLMGLQVLPVEPAFEPMIVDTPDFGAVTATQSTVELDFYAGPNAGVFIAMTIGPNSAGQVIPGIDLPAAFGSGHFGAFFALPNSTLPTPISLFAGITDANGYFNLSVPNPSTPNTIGTTLVWHGLSSATSVVRLGNPAILQYK